MHQTPLLQNFSVSSITHKKSHKISKSLIAHISALNFKYSLQKLNKSVQSTKEIFCKMFTQKFPFNSMPQNFHQTSIPIPLGKIHNTFSFNTLYGII